MQLKGRDAAAMAAIGVLWVAMAWLAHPAGEFPVADDWSYATSIRDLLTTGRVGLHPFTPTIAFSHIVLGAAVSSAFGFSFETLRVAMLVVGLVGVWATYLLLREIVPSRLCATLAALTVATNPMYFLLAGSFMTDVSFYAMATLALWAFAWTLRTDSRLAFCLAMLASSLALLNRQIGIALPVGFACAAIVCDGGTRLLRALTPLLVGGCALLTWQALVPSAGGPSLVANSKLVEAAEFLSGPIADVLRRAGSNVLDWILYLGLLTLPFVLAIRSGAPVTAARVATTCALLAISWLVLGARLMPALPPNGNWLLPTGVGPLTLRDTMVLRLDNVPHLPWLCLVGFTMLSIWSSAWCLDLAWLGVRSVVERPRAPSSGVQTMLAIVGLLWIAPSLVSFFFDRYELPLLPVAFGLITGFLATRPIVTSRSAVAGALAAIALQIAISVAAAHDYYAWNRARLAELDWLLTEQKVAPSSVDAGFEWSGWNLFDPAYRATPEKSWWWVQDDSWVVSFGPIPGMREVRRVSFQRWLPPWDSGAVVLLAR